MFKFLGLCSGLIILAVLLAVAQYARPEDCVWKPFGYYVKGSYLSCK